MMRQHDERHCIVNTNRCEVRWNSLSSVVVSSPISWTWTKTIRKQKISSKVFLAKRHEERKTRKNEWYTVYVVLGHEYEKNRSRRSVLIRNVFWSHDWTHMRADEIATWPFFQQNDVTADITTTTIRGNTIKICLPGTQQLQSDWNIYLIYYCLC